MKRILIALTMTVTAFTACNIGNNGYDGEAFIKLNWSEVEPAYINPNGVVPNDFAWDTYYYTTPGRYIIHTEYERTYNSGRTVVYPYDTEIEIFVIEGEPGRTRGRDGRDATEDVLFDLDLFPDGEIDFTHVLETRTTYETKSATINEKVVVKEGSEQNGKYGMKYTTYRLPEYIK